MDTIRQIVSKIKSLAATENGRDILVIGVVILACTGSFFLGRMSKSDAKDDQVKIVGAIQNFPSGNASQESSQIQNGTTGSSQTSDSGAYVASKNGTKYYPVGCSGAKRIKPENTVYFDTPSAAEAAGYALSSVCK